MNLPEPQTPKVTFTISELDKIIKEVYQEIIKEQILYHGYYNIPSSSIFTKIDRIVKDKIKKHCKREFYGLELELVQEDYVDLPWRNGEFYIDHFWRLADPVMWNCAVDEAIRVSETVAITEYRLKEIIDLGDMWIAKYYR